MKQVNPSSELEPAKPDSEGEDTISEDEEDADDKEERIHAALERKREVALRTSELSKAKQVEQEKERSGSEVSGNNSSLES